MNKTIAWLTLGTVWCLLISSCASSRYGYAVKKESARMKVVEKNDAINYSSLKPQLIPSFAERKDNARGIVLAPLLGSAVSLATDGIKKMIANDRKKYTAEYKFALNDLYFYDQLSTESVFDPAGLQFSGFTLIRTFVNKEGITDTALVANFVLDTSRASEIINNSIFRLRLKDLRLYYAKAKITAGQKKSINMDIEISFTTSYVNQSGQLFDNVTLGKFYLLLRDAPLDKEAAGYAAYYENLKNKPVDGRSFIVPRSFGYYLAANNVPQQCYSQGAYSVNVKVKETSKDKFVTKVLMDNSSQIIDMLGGKAKDALKKK